MRWSGGVSLGDDGVEITTSDRAERFVVFLEPCFQLADAVTRCLRAELAIDRCQFPAAGSPDVETPHHPWLVGEIADDAAQRLGGELDQGRRCNHLVLLCHRRLLIDVDHLQIHPPGEVLFADPLNIGRLHRSDRAELPATNSRR